MKRTKDYPIVLLNDVEYEVTAKLENSDDWGRIEDDYGRYVGERDVRGEWHIDRRKGTLHDPSGDVVYQSEYSHYVDSNSCEYVIPSNIRINLKTQDPRKHFKYVQDKEWLRKQLRTHGSWAKAMYAEVMDDWWRMERINDQDISVVNIEVSVYANGRKISECWSGHWKLENSEDWKHLEDSAVETLEQAWYEAREFLTSIGATPPQEDVPEEFEQQVRDQIHDY